MDNFIEDIMVELSREMIHHYDYMPIHPSYSYPAYPQIYNPLQTMAMMPMMGMPPFFATGFAPADTIIGNNDDDDEVFQQQLLGQMNNVNANSTNNISSNSNATPTTDEETFARGYGAILGLKSSSSSSSSSAAVIPPTGSQTLPQQPYNPYTIPNPYGINIINMS